MRHTNDKRVELHNHRVMNYTGNLLRDINTVVNILALNLRSDRETIQDITVKYILEDNHFYRITFYKQLGILNFD